MKGRGAGVLWAPRLLTQFRAPARRAGALQPSQTTRGRPHERSRPTVSSLSPYDRELNFFEFRTFQSGY